LAFYAANTLANSGSDPAAKILLLTFTVLMWPAAVIGVFLLLSWAVLRAGAG
jgi:hypothetical protein